jgi:hypothetical protein
MTCSECNGTGKCRHCNGTGDGAWLEPHPSKHLIHEDESVDCPVFGGDGECVQCGGSGEEDD